jgi:nucleotide-binding universal stress UspA family protein
MHGWTLTMRVRAPEKKPGKCGKHRYISQYRTAAKVTLFAVKARRRKLAMADERRLLVPIDGSNHSLRALAHVIKRVASDGQIQIFVLNVQLPLPPSLFVTRSMIADHNKTKSKEDLARALRMLDRSAVKAEILVRVGELGETIVKVARQKHCGEIVLGSRGLGNLKGLILGSVTTKVIHAARVPVTVVP